MVTWPLDAGAVGRQHKKKERKKKPRAGN